MVNQKIIVKETTISFFPKGESDYISLTDIAKYKNAYKSKDLIKNWMRNKSTVEFLGLWERINNPNFKGVEFDPLINSAGGNAFLLSPSKWIKRTGAIGITSKRGTNGGTFAHKDIAFEFAFWISAEFKLYLIKEFQRLKSKESSEFQQEWDAKRFLVKANYRVHTDAVKKKLIPPKVSKNVAGLIYASEGDVLNIAMFGKTARQWREENKGKKGNIRDYADIMQLVCLAGLESLNAEFIRQGHDHKQRIEKLNEIAIIQMESLMGKIMKK